MTNEELIKKELLKTPVFKHSKPLKGQNQTQNRAL